MRVFDLAFEALAYLFENFRTFIVISMFPIIISLLFYTYISFYLVKINGLNTDNNEKVIESFILKNIWLFTVFNFVFMIFIIAFIIVMWHRYIILDEAPWQGIGERLRAALKYVLVSILIGLVSALFTVPLFILVIFLADGNLLIAADASIWLRFANFVSGVVLFVLTFRFSLVLVETAIGRNSGGIWWSWAATRPLSIQIIGLALVTSVLGTASQILAVMVYEIPIADLPKGVILGALTVAILFLQTFVAAGAMSLAYRKLVLDRHDQTGQTAV